MIVFENYLDWKNRGKHFMLKGWVYYHKTNSFIEDWPIRNHRFS